MNVQPKVSTTNMAGGISDPSPLETDMAEQGRKARASAARLERLDSIGPLSIAGRDRGTDGGAMNGMMPLRCGVSGRQGGVLIFHRDE